MKFSTAIASTLVFFSMAPLTLGQDLTTDQQVGAAIQAIPEALRAGATVMGYESDGLAVIREGDGDMICLADNPGDERFHVACYHKSLEPFMARGRELTAEGKNRQERQDIREKEANDGTLKMPEHPAALYALSGEEGAYDYEAGLVVKASPHFVVYMPWATEATTGLATSPVSQGAPWIMDPGKPWAHIMVVTGQTRSDAASDPE